MISSTSIWAEVYKSDYCSIMSHARFGSSLKTADLKNKKSSYNLERSSMGVFVWFNTFDILMRFEYNWFKGDLIILQSYLITTLLWYKIILLFEFYSKFFIKQLSVKKKLKSIKIFKRYCKYIQSPSFVNINWNISINLKNVTL